MFRNVSYSTILIQEAALWGLESGRALAVFDIIHLPYHYIYIYQIPFMIQLGDLEFRHRYRVD